MTSTHRTSRHSAIRVDNVVFDIAPLNWNNCEISLSVLSPFCSACTITLATLRLATPHSATANQHLDLTSVKRQEATPSRQLSSPPPHLRHSSISRLGLCSLPRFSLCSVLSTSHSLHFYFCAQVLAVFMRVVSGRTSHHPRKAHMLSHCSHIALHVA